MTETTEETRVPRPRALATALAVAAAALSLASPAGASAGSDRTVTVMSRNLYLGADIIRAAGAPDRAALAQAATELFDVVRRTGRTSRCGRRPSPARSTARIPT